MMDEWFYKAFGEEHGPVSFERLREMASKNQLSPQDRVRSAEWKEWVAARTVPQLFPKHRLEAASHAAEDIDDLDFHSIQLADSETERDLTNLDELDIQVSEAPTTTAKASGRVDAYGSPIEAGAETASTSLDDFDIQIAEAPSAAKPSGPVDGYGSPLRDGEEEEQWFCQTLGHQLGPMPLADLRLMAKKGELGLDDDVRRADETEWRPARTIEGLFPGFQYTPPPESFGENAPRRRMPRTCRCLMPWLMASIRRWRDSPARKFPPPRPWRKCQAASAKEIAGAEERPVSTQTGGRTARRNAGSQILPAGLQRGEASPMALRRRPHRTGKVGRAGHHRDRSSLRAFNGTTTSAAAQYQARMAELARQQATFKKSAPKSKVQGPSLGERFSDLGEKFKENPKVWGVLAVLALVLIIKYVPWPFGTGDQEFLDRITQIGNTYKELRTKNAPPAEFDAFKQKSLPLVIALKTELENAGAGSKRSAQAGNVLRVRQSEIHDGRRLAEQSPTAAEKEL